MSSRLRTTIVALVALGLAAQPVPAGASLAERARQVEEYLRASVPQRLEGGLTMTAAKAVGDRVEITVRMATTTLSAVEAGRLQADFIQVCKRSTIFTRHAAAGGTVDFRFENPAGRELTTVALTKQNCRLDPVPPEQSAQTAAAVLAKLQPHVGPGKGYSKLSLRGEREIVMELPIPGVDSEARARQLAADRARAEDAKLKTAQGICDGPINDVFRIAIEEGVVLTMQYVGAGMKLLEFSIDRAACGGRY